MTVFDDGIVLEAQGNGVLRGRTIPEWANMVGPYGGITAATLLGAIELQPDVHGFPVALTVNYLAPIVDGDFRIRARAVRTNRSNQHWWVELSQDNGLKATATAVFAVRRETWTDTELQAPAVPEPDGIANASADFGLVWPRNYDMRFVEGGLPGPGAGENPSSTTTLWVRDAQPRPLDFAALTSVCDIFYPRVFLRRGQFLPAGTISFTVYFHADQADLTEQGDGFLLATARAQRFAAGHFDQTAQIWSRAGTLLATTHQLVYYKG